MSIADNYLHLCKSGTEMWHEDRLKMLIFPNICLKHVTGRNYVQGTTQYMQMRAQRDSNI